MTASNERRGGGGRQTDKQTEQADRQTLLGTEKRYMVAQRLYDTKGRLMCGIFAEWVFDAHRLASREEENTA